MPKHHLCSSVFICGYFVLVAAGCAVLPEWDEEVPPPDFALVFTVFPRNGIDASELTRPAQHILTPDRVYRVALGPGVTHDLFPPATAKVSPGEVERLWAIVREHDLDTRSRGGTEADPYRVSITAGGRTWRYDTGPDDDGAVALLRELIRMRGG